VAPRRLAAQRLARHPPVQQTERAVTGAATVAVVLLVAGRPGVADVRRGHAQRSRITGWLCAVSRSRISGLRYIKIGGRSSGIAWCGRPVPGRVIHLGSTRRWAARFFGGSGPFLSFLRLTGRSLAEPVGPLVPVLSGGVHRLA
jgi:hypothetical protein